MFLTKNNVEAKTLFDSLGRDREGWTYLRKYYEENKLKLSFTKASS